MPDPNPPSTVPAGGTGQLRLYRLVPIAQSDDPHWDRAADQGEVVVCAYSTGDARLVAAEAEGSFLETDAKPAQGTTTAEASAFRDDKLYTVEDEPGDQRAAPLERGVVSGTVRRAVLGEPVRDRR